MGINGRLVTSPGWAIVVGLLAGALSVLGYAYCTPFLESKFRLYDTCGVGNLHGLPSILGGFASMAFIGMNPNATFLSHSSTAVQIGAQAEAMVATFFLANISGYVTGKLIALLNNEEKAMYSDNAWWKTEYFEPSRHAREMSRHTPEIAF
jgi:ammonium transporter Rh